MSNDDDQFDIWAEEEAGSRVTVSCLCWCAALAIIAGCAVWAAL